MEGLILNEETKYVTYMCPIFDALGDDYIRSLNWRIVYPECGSVEQVYSFEHTKTSWISGDELPLSEEVIQRIDSFMSMSLLIWEKCLQ